MLRHALDTDQHERLHRHRWSGVVAVLVAAVLAGAVATTNTASAAWLSMNTNLVQHVLACQDAVRFEYVDHPLSRDEVPDPTDILSIRLGIAAGPGPDTPVRAIPFPPPPTFEEPFPIVVDDVLTVPFGPKDIGTSSNREPFNNYGLYTYALSGGQLAVGSALLYVFGYPDLRNAYIDIPSTSSTRFLVENCRLLDERVAPSCAIVGQSHTPDGATSLVFELRDHGSGIAQVQSTAGNATVSPLYLAHGTTDPIRITATGLDATGMAVTIDAVDTAGNKRSCSAHQVVVTAAPGTPRPQTVTGLPQGAGQLTIQNDTPGVTTMKIRVNTQIFTMSGLADGEQRTLDVSAALRTGTDNTITLIPIGRPSGTATVLIAAT